MKSIATQHGEVIILEKEQPYVKPNCVLVKTRYSMVSPGTEMTAIRRQAEQPHPLGYSAAGIAVEVGEDVPVLKEGQAVACYGAPYVNHSEYLLVPKHLIVPVPEHVELRSAASAGLGAIAIHALRQSELKFGECAVVVGLGIIGQLIARIAHAAALKVVAIDLLESRRELLQDVEGITICKCIEEVPDAVRQATGGIGADAVLHCAAGRQMELFDSSFDWLRDRGTVVIVGDMTVEYTRAKMFGKEARVLISRAGGPGRYDQQYEQDCVDYPVGYVRWTEGRNIGEYIRLLSERRIEVESLLSKQVPLSRAHELYADYANEPQNILGALIAYEA
ncbi:zinc-binding alcohol dehydrogenase [Paenibacillus sp. J5C_2022]|uniref:zinc-dependent alcohol dehydrogenase n=1 Tax=Paenibacillus sp. J5C2022 TaxID=2977129 RepID=UPI0021D2ADA5|nr:zinc-binding alcohol dehydrogenase [Paenibacillus sp. J5C2022]MCU6707319.1 zinc-binding alcohol dehydrogenase [Paenibacillus sp. J5C2022]